MKLRMNSQPTLKKTQGIEIIKKVKTSKNLINKLYYALIENNIQIKLYI